LSDTLPILKYTYQDRIDMTVKVLHLPTFYKAMDERLAGNRAAFWDIDAAIFAFCLVAVSALTDQESRQLFGEAQEVMRRRYRRACREALGNAKFFSTTKPVVLAALVLYIVSHNSQSAGP
jgi:hypothetical protein